MIPKGLNALSLSNSKRNGEQMAKTMTSNKSLTVHHTDYFLGRDEEDGRRASSGLTQWVANNFDLLFKDQQPPYDYRRVEPMTRARWEEYSLEILERWLSKQSCRKIVRKSIDWNNSVQFVVFPHPEDAEVMDLSGPGGELPSMLMHFKPLDQGQSCIASVFRKIPAPQIEATDMILTCPMSVRAAYNGSRQEVAPHALVNAFNGLSSKVSEMEEELVEWKQFLEWMESSHNENKWEGEITKAEFVDSENPIIRLHVQSEGRHLGLLKHIPTDYKTDSTVFIKSKADNDSIAEEIQNDAGKVELGQAKRMKRPKDLPKKEVILHVRLDKALIPDPTKLIGQLLVNDPDKRAGSLKREKDGLERLQNMQAPCNLHHWIFDISKAQPGPSEPPALKHPLVDQLNEQQEFAVRSALAAPEVYLIQGPPGTGKTTVIAELTNQLTHEGQRVLIASQTNLAVDNALGRLKSKTNVRPVRHLGHFAAQDPDPESEPFLENNVVESFFLPSVRDECAKAQERALKLRADATSVQRFLSEAEGLVGLVNQFKRERKEVEQTKQTFSLQRLEIERAAQEKESQVRILVRALANIEAGRWNDVQFGEMEDGAHLQSMLTAVQEGLKSQERLPLLYQAILTLNNVSGEGAVSEEVAALRTALDKAAYERDFEAASALQKELKLLEENQRKKGNSQWADDTRDMARLGAKLNDENMTAMAQQRTPPENFNQWRVERVAEFESEIQTIQQDEKTLSVQKEEFNDLLLTRRSTLDDVKEVSLVGTEQALQKANEQLEMLERKHADALRNYAELHAMLPTLNIDESDDDGDSATRPQGHPEAEMEELLVACKNWQQEHQGMLEKEEAWINIRKEWIEAIDSTEASAIEDLKKMYLTIVNVHGATTSLCGSSKWYSEHAAEPFDVVIIDEISKATAPEIILACLLAKKVIWVGDHRQLPPEWNDPRIQTSEDEQDDLDDHRNAGEYRYKEMVTTALFERHFIDAAPSLKATLNVQYRMHSTIMNTINEFYGGELKAGLGQKEKELKQHGFIIKKKDDFGSKFGAGSHLIYPEKAVYWLDSAFDRKGNYCEEVQDGTSKVNLREIHLGIKLLDEFNQQVELWKKENTDPEDWATHVHLRHLVKGKMPVAFITTYAAQKRIFDLQAFGGGDNTSEERWPHLDVKVDTVDRFQGGERPVVIVSLVNSSPVGKDQLKEIQRLLKKHGEPTANWLTNNQKSSKNTVAIRPPRSMFAKSPNRVNVAFSRAQNLLIILGNRWGWRGAKVKIKRDEKDEQGQNIVESVRFFDELQNQLRGGVVDGRELL
jgi:DNA polymerase III delta prime subunit